MVCSSRKWRTTSPADKAQLQRGLYAHGRLTATVPADLMPVADVLSTKTKGDHVQLAVVVAHRVGNDQTDTGQGTVEVPVR